MSGQLANVGRDGSDESFRYKMPVLTTKIEGFGNGIKTVLTNMQAVADALHVHPSYPVKFMAMELGAVSSCSASANDKNSVKAVVNGAHQSADMAKLLDKYIKKYVLCPKCKLPELESSVPKSRDRLVQTCVACGAVQVRQSCEDKLIKHMVTSGRFVKPPGAVGRAKQTPIAIGMGPATSKDSKEAPTPEPEQAKADLKETPTREEWSSDKWSSDTSQEAQRKRVEAEFGGPKPTRDESGSKTHGPLDAERLLTDVLEKAAGEKKAADRAALVSSELHRIALVRSLTPIERFSLLLKVCLATAEAGAPAGLSMRVLAAFKRNMELWKAAVKGSDGNRIAFLQALQDHLVAGKINLKVLPHMLQALQDDADFTDHSFLTWRASCTPKDVKTAATAFIDTLE